MRDQSAQIARYILTADIATPKAQCLVFNLIQCFDDAPPEQLRRGIEIALEIVETEAWAKQVAKNGDAIELPAFLQKGGAE